MWVDDLIIAASNEKALKAVTMMLKALLRKNDTEKVCWENTWKVQHARL